ncbi:uncharacterized protein IUM83_07373 [Phytophthora cinnamomi]|uniref:uncharacterized protein n=1 Tax=Phytophthora cinnamomi TaxID=4785 RepID=UPI003559C385|nr:hypothetical protein IUM83_07373 [Phytophthora cinnamomi]
MAASEYAAYATQVSDALRTLLQTTGVRMETAAEFVSCGAGRREHFVPKASLERHLRKCHGERRPHPINNAAFYYGSNVGGHADRGGSDPVEKGADNDQGDDNDGELQSLLEPEVLQNEEREANADQVEGLIASIEKIATSARDFYEQVRGWKRIPRAFAAMKNDERELVTSTSLHQWLNSELRQPGILPSDDPLDEELVEYVARLLDHPDFCQPDLLALELHEFLGGSVTSFVLALWKFLVVEIGLHSVFVRCSCG